MKNALRSATYMIAVGVCLALIQSPVAAGESPDERPMVDFRMTPLEQAKKIHRMASARTGAEVTITVMNTTCDDGTGDRSHLILNENPISRSSTHSGLFRGPAHSISWTSSRYRAAGACDSQAECRKKVEELCKGAGHGGAQHLTVTVTTHSDGSKTCSGDCKGNGAVAFVTCSPK